MEKAEESVVIPFRIKKRLEQLMMDYAEEVNMKLPSGKRKLKRNTVFVRLVVERLLDLKKIDYDEARRLM